MPNRWFDGFQNLSLDIVAGVACAAAFAVSVTGAAMPLLWWVLLPLATWVVYSADHLLDALRTGAGAQQSRHRFYHRRFTVLTGITLCLLVAGAFAGLLWLPNRLLLPGLIAGTAAVLHLVLAQGRNHVLAKEVSTASIYAGSIWFGPLLMAPGVDVWTLAFAALHLLAAFLNLIAFALFEEDLDGMDDHASIVRSWGRRNVGRLLTVLTVAGVAGVLLTTVLTPQPRPAASLVLLALVVIPGVMVRHGEVFAPGQRYRTVGDLAFLMLIIPFLLGR